MSASAFRSALGAIAATALLALSGCSIPLNDAARIADTNTCSTDDQCNPGSKCVAVASGDKICVAGSGSLGSLVFEVIPAAGSPYGGDDPFIFEPSNAVDASMSTSSFDVRLPKLVSAAPGQVTYQYDLGPDCTATGPFVANVELAQTYQYRGLLTKKYTSMPPMIAPPPSAGQVVFGFDATIPPGVYDVYIDPQTPDKCAKLPPVFLPSQPIGEGGFSQAFSAPIHVTGSLTLPPMQSFTGWFLEILEPDHGKLISPVQTIKQDPLDFSVPIDLRFYLFKGKVPYIRLRPPEQLHAPSVYWSISAAATKFDPKTQEEIVLLSVDDLEVNPRHVKARVEDDHGNGVAASVIIESESLSGMNSGNAAYTTTVKTADGDFETDLPPGSYRVVAIPDDMKHAIAIEDPKDMNGFVIEAGKTCFCGHVVNVHDLAVLTGTVLGRGSPLPMTAVQATPSITKEVPFITSQVTPQPFDPRQQATQTDGLGSFYFGVDPGSYDVTARPLATTGFPWHVLPRVPISAQKGSVMSSDLGTMEIEDPIVVSGRVVDPDGNAVAQASISAWLPVKDTLSVIQIGEAITRADGTYVLPLPPSTGQ